MLVRATSTKLPGVRTRIAVGICAQQDILFLVEEFNRTVDDALCLHKLARRQTNLEVRDTPRFPERHLNNPKRNAAMGLPGQGHRDETPI